jgi:hypothetical protein
MSSEVIRTSCPRCSYSGRTAIWCAQPPCCDPDLATFLATLAVHEQRAAGPVFAVRFLDRPDKYQPDAKVTLWRPGSVAPVFTGPLSDAQQFVLRHDCRPAAAGPA